MIRALVEGLEKRLEQMAGLLCVILLLCLFLEVVNRYLFFTSWPEIQFIIPFCFLWMCMFSSAVAVRKGQHFEVDFLAKIFKGRAWRVHGVLMQALIVFSGIVIFYSSIKFVDLGFVKKNPATGIRMVYIYSSILIGGALVSLMAMSRLLSMTGTGEEEQ